MIKLVVQPTQTPLSWEKFVETTPQFSIALDGYVSGGPRFDPKRVVATMNHHEDVDRLATRSTCAQVLMAIRQGLFKTFRNHEGPQATVYVNDADEDVCTSWYLLKHHAVCEQTMNPLLNRLVMMEDALDATGGAYPFPKDLPVLRELAWIFEPYRKFRLSGQLDKKDPQAYQSIIEDVAGRIGRHITGDCSEMPLDTRYERIGGGAGWAMVKEIGGNARTGMFSDGITAYVSVRELGNAKWAYTVGRMSNFIRFDCERIFDACNAAEFEHPDLKEKLLSLGPPTPDRWGGSPMIGGSPRVGGSKIPPSILEKIINEVAL
jgi:hypothetical protein